MTDFVDVAKREFAFLETGYGFQLDRIQETASGGLAIYRNSDRGVGIKIQYDFADAFVFMGVYKLVDGQMGENILPITDEKLITCFDFNDMLEESAKMKPSYEYPENSPYFDPTDGLRNYVAEFALRLRRYGGALLGGDFSRLPEMAGIIKSRARRL